VAPGASSPGGSFGSSGRASSRRALRLSAGFALLVLSGELCKLLFGEAAMICARVTFEITNHPVEREHTMTKRQPTSEASEIKALLSADGDFLRSVMQAAVQAALEAEMMEALAAERSERRGYRSGSYSRSLITRVGTIELRVPRDRSGLFSTELFERYQRSEKALVSALAEMYVQGVSTRKVKAVTETLCGHGFSASAISGTRGRWTVWRNSIWCAARPTRSTAAACWCSGRQPVWRSNANCARSCAMPRRPCTSPSSPRRAGVSGRAPKARWRRGETRPTRLR
jgi:hypothetical protein